jgi:hypothetical protein
MVAQPLGSVFGENSRQRQNQNHQHNVHRTRMMGDEERGIPAEQIVYRLRDGKIEQRDEMQRTPEDVFAFDRIRHVVGVTRLLETVIVEFHRAVLHRHERDAMSG